MILIPQKLRVHWQLREILSFLKLFFINIIVYYYYFCSVRGPCRVCVPQCHRLASCHGTSYKLPFLANARSRRPSSSTSYYFCSLFFSGAPRSCWSGLHAARLVPCIHAAMHTAPAATEPRGGWSTYLGIHPAGTKHSCSPYGAVPLSTA